MSARFNPTPFPPLATPQQAGLMSGADKAALNAAVAKLAGMQRPLLRLQYIPAVDLASPLSMPTANTWYDIGAAQSFAWSGPTAVGIAWVSGNVFGGGQTAILGSRLLFDTGQSQALGGGYGQNVASSNFNSYLSGAGPVWLAALPAGTRTVKLQVSANIANAVAYCRPGSVPQESLRIVVVEFAP